MSRLYLRQVFVDVGDSTDAVRVPNTFKIAIDVQKRLSSASAGGSVTFFNLAANTKAIIRDRGQRIRIFAGYGKDISLLHDGDILRTEPVDEGVNRKIVLYLGAKVFKTTDAIFSKSYQNSVKVRQIANDALTTYNVPFSTDILNTIPAGETMQNFSHHGRTTDALNSLLQPLGLQHFEQNDQIFISKKQEALTNDRGDVIVLNANSGLIKTAVRTDRGVNVTALLNPRLQPGKIIKVESNVAVNASFNTYFVDKPQDNATGFFKIIQTDFKGDNWDGQFQCLLQCIPFGSDAT